MPSGQAGNKVRNYILYAIGEIALVMIGILLALQVNNWNQERANDKLADKFLIGIKADMQRDIEQADRILEDISTVVSLVHSIDPDFWTPEIYQTEDYGHLFTEPDSIYFDRLFRRGLSFRTNKGTYSSLIADGKTGLIKNRELFESIQIIYENYNQRLSSVYETIKVREDYIAQEYAYEKRYWGYSDLKRRKEEKIFLDIANFIEMSYSYGIHLTNTKGEMNKAIVMIDEELGVK